MVYSQSPPLAEKDLNLEGLLLDGRARDLDARSERRIEIPPNKPSIRSSHSSARKDREVVHDRPSVGRRLFRTVTRFFIAVLIGVGITLAWQSYGDVARQILAVQAPGLAELLPVSTKSPLVPAPSADPMQQLAPLVSNFDALRRNLEQLAAKQEQMAQNIAALQAVDEEIKQKISSSPPMQQPASITQTKPVQPRAESPALQSAPAPRRPPLAAPPPVASPSR
jgi:hypothetical protein